MYHSKVNLYTWTHFSAVMWFMEWDAFILQVFLQPAKHDPPLKTQELFPESFIRTNIPSWWIGQWNNGSALIQNWYKDISLVTIWSRSSQGCWQEAFWHSLPAIWGALIESTATISQRWISVLKEVAGERCEESVPTLTWTTIYENIYTRIVKTKIILDLLIYALCNEGRNPTEHSTVE